MEPEKGANAWRGPESWRESSGSGGVVGASETSYAKPEAGILISGRLSTIMKRQTYAAV